MRTNVSEELSIAIDKKIMLDIEIHYLNQKLEQAEKDNNDGFANYIEKILKEQLKKRFELRKFLTDNGVKIDKPERSRNNFSVSYHYSIKVNGGYKEGTNSYTIHWIKSRLKNKINQYFKRSDSYGG